MNDPQLGERLHAILSASRDQTNPSLMSQATTELQNWENAKADEFLVALTQVLCDSNKTAEERQLAGIIMKNAVSAKDPAKDKNLKQRWTAFNLEVKNFIREKALNALVDGYIDYSNATLRGLIKAISSFLAKLAMIDVLNNHWERLIPTLKDHALDETKIASSAKPALIALGYISEELVLVPEEMLTGIQTQIDFILTAVVGAMRSQDAEVKLHGTKAFYFTVMLARTNFASKDDRDAIVKVVVENCRCMTNQATQVAAFECLVQIAQEYYQYLSEDYLKCFGDLTFAAITRLPEIVALPAMEFWSTICDEEAYILDEIRESHGTSQAKNLGIILQAREPLVNMLLETMAKHDGNSREWNLAMAAATCLHLASQVIGDAMVDQVMQYVERNLHSQDWKCREAAILAYGSILEGSSREKIGPLIAQSAGFVYASLSDENENVRDTTAWTIGNICKCHYDILNVRDLVPRLLERLTDTPRVATNACFVLHVLAEKQGDPSNPPSTTSLSDFFESIVRALICVAARDDSTDEQLIIGAFNALGVLISRAGNDRADLFPQLLNNLMEQLTNSFTEKEIKERSCTIHGLICGCLQALTQRMKGSVEQHAPRLMELYLKTFQAFADVKQSPCLLEETLQAVGALCRAIQAKFEHFMPNFHPFLIAGLKNHQDVTVCRMATGVVGDLCRVLEKKFAPWAKDTILALGNLLQDPSVDRSISASILLAFGDIAMAITGDFEEYFPPVMEKLVLASMTRIDQVGGPQNEDSVIYLNNLRDGVLEAYTGIIHGFRESNKLHVFKGNVNIVLDFIKSIVMDYETYTQPRVVSNEVMKSSAGLIGDLIYVYQTELVSNCFESDGAGYVKTLIQFCQQCPDESTKKTLSWLNVLIQKYSSGAR
eukprot:GEMP01004065.1.p1 GENE.GEMP01004065.1~~GEMP01004065.1.p1  ORF type:complete len:890 (+),score=156.76 GEMP01004065.1:26-2695(+)